MVEYLSNQLRFQNLTLVQQSCVQSCMSCSEFCSYFIECFFRYEKANTTDQCIKNLQDCSKICQIMAEFILLNHEFHQSTCEICIKICLECADKIRPLVHQKYFLKAVVESCEECVINCQKMMAPKTDPFIRVYNA